MAGSMMQCGDFGYPDHSKMTTLETSEMCDVYYTFSGTQRWSVYSGPVGGTLASAGWLTQLWAELTTYHSADQLTPTP